jgi:hypothetical protein
MAQNSAVLDNFGYELTNGSEAVAQTLTNFADKFLAYDNPDMDEIATCASEHPQCPQI